MNCDFWKNRRVFVTGHTGFKGGWLTLWLGGMGAEVHGYALDPPTTPNFFSLCEVRQSLASHTLDDVRHGAALIAAMQAAQPEIVFHLAAQPLVRQSYRDPVETYAVNVMGTVNLLEGVRACPSVKAVVNVTTDKCYENREWHWGYRENESMGGYDPYSSSKGCAELVTSAYRNSFFQAGPAVASARAGNVIGGGDWAEDRLIPDMMRAAMEGRTVLLRNPCAIRPWQHVLEPLAGYLTLAERLHADGAAFAEGWNFGPVDDDARPVEWIAQKISSLWEGMTWKHDLAPHPHEAHYLKLDCSKARARLEWTPQLSLADTLAWTVEWYKSYSESVDMRWLSKQQIENYSELMKK